MNTLCWAYMHGLYYAPLFMAIAGILVIRLHKKERVVCLLGKRMVIHYSWTRCLVKTILMIGALIALFIALLGPRLSGQAKTVVRHAHDILIALDISRSMLVKDCHPNRLEYAKQQIKSLLERMPGDRVGLLLFCKNAFIHCPLTADRAAFIQFLDAIDSYTIGSGTTALDQPIKKALEIFKTMPSTKNRLLLLVTDGEDFSGNMDALKQEMEQQRITIFTIGVGTAIGGPIPQLDPQGNQIGHQVDQQGKVIISCLNSALLKQLAQKTGGHYVDGAHDASTIDQIVGRINQAQKEQFGMVNGSYEPLYPYAVAISLLLVVLEWIL